jgi:hypothetical protein
MASNPQGMTDRQLKAAEQERAARIQERKDARAYAVAQANAEETIPATGRHHKK